MPQLLIVVILFRLLILIIPSLEQLYQRARRRIQRFFKSNKYVGIFDHSYIDARTFYMQEFNQTPCVSSIANVDVTKAYAYIAEGKAGQVLDVYQRNHYNWTQKQIEFSATVFKLENKVVIRLGHDYAEVLFANSNYVYANGIIELLSTYQLPEKEEDFEINIITRGAQGLDLKQLAIQPTTLDIDLYYNDDFKPIDELVKSRLAKQNDKGIILFHGLPGTGKTTYLRHLIGSLKKRVLFVSPSVAGNLMDPEFIDLLIDNPNAVVVIEDAENIIMDRKYSAHSSVSNLLNISDGLLSDCLNVQIICTFNSDLNLVDSALLRKGRLIAKYEFGKLDAAKAQRLSDHLGFETAIHQPMTLAEITNPGDMEAAKPSVQVLGFRRDVLMN